MESRGFTIILIGSTIRSAAQSATRGGFRVVGMDQFGDQDTRDACAEFARINDFEQVSQLLGQHPTAPIIQVSGLSNLANWTTIHESVAARLSPSVPIQQALADPAMLKSLAAVSGFRFPRTFDSECNPIPNCNPIPSGNPTGRWLFKPTDGSGGLGIQWYAPPAHRDDFSATGSPGWIQRWIPGRSFGATLILGDSDVVVLGICRSLYHRVRGAGYAFPFVYSGSFGPLPCHAGLVQSLTRMGREIVAVSGLRGLCNIDFVIDHEGVSWLLEINPRWSGSSELIERQRQESGEIKAGSSLFSIVRSESVRSFRDQELGGEAYLKQVVFAPVDFRFCWDYFRRICDPAVELRDIPTEGSMVESGTPILTLITRVDSSEPSALRSMRSYVRDIRDVARRQGHSPFSSANDLIR